MEERDSKNRVNRRKFMKGVSATAASGALAGPAVACSDAQLDSKMAEAREKYTDPQTVQKIINDRSPLLNALRSDGLLSRPKISVGELLSVEEYLNSSEGVRVWGLNYPGVGATAHITVRRRVGNGTLAIAINPDLDNGPRALFKPDTMSPDAIGGEPVTRYLSRSQGDAPQKLKKYYTEKRPDEISDTLQSSSTERSTSTDDISTQGQVVGLCRNRGGSGCDSYRCYAWEGECFGDSCEIYDCSGNICHGGCCTCEEEDWCCEVCGDYVCESDPCENVSYPC